MNNLKLNLLTCIMSLCIMFATADLSAQKRGHHHHGKGKIHAELELTDAQKESIESLRKKMREEMTEIKSSDLSEEEKHEKFKALKERHKQEFEAVLTPEQKEKMEALHAKKKERHEKKWAEKTKRMEELKPMMEELKAYGKKNIQPAIQAQRDKLDKKMNRKDRKEVKRLKAVAMEAQEEMVVEMKKRKEAMENGEHPPRPHHGKKGHHGKRGHHGMKPPHKGEMMVMMTMMKKYGEDFTKAVEMANKYGDEIDGLMKELEPKHEQWKKEMMQIKSKYISEEEMNRWKGHKKGRKGAKGSCDKSKCEGKSKENCDKSKCEGKEKGPKGKKGKHHGFKHEMMKNVKRVGFLLMDPMMMEQLEKELMPEMNRQPAPTETIVGSDIETKVFPNPSDDRNTLQVIAPESGQVKISLFNKEGKLVRSVASERVEAGTLTYDVDLTGLPTGLYYYQLDYNGQISTVKFVKR